MFAVRYRTEILLLGPRNELVNFALLGEKVRDFFHSLKGPRLSQGSGTIG